MYNLLVQCSYQLALQVHKLYLYTDDESVHVQAVLTNTHAWTIIMYMVEKEMS